jgi:hypothetical protein
VISFGQRIKCKEQNSSNWIIGSTSTYTSEFFTGAKKNCKSRQKNDVITDHPRTASPKGRRRLFVSSQNTGRKDPDEVRRSLHSINYKTGGICRQEGRSTNINCQNAPTQHQLSSVADS